MFAVRLHTPISGMRFGYVTGQETFTGQSRLTVRLTDNTFHIVNRSDITYI